MTMRLFDHLDLRVSDLAKAEAFYGVVLPALGFHVRGTAAHCIYFEARRDHPKPEFVALIEDRSHVPTATRIAFWQDTKDQVDKVAALLAKAGAQNVEGPMFNPEYSPTYYAVFFEDPSGNRLEVCCRVAKPSGA
jgi:catechol 2,3-dioxygenase-like lactoylglutathione lyase family enzyme